MAAGPETETTAEERLAQRALLLRDADCSYAEIGRRLACSKGKAHHIVGDACKQRDDVAHDVVRPPGQRREPTLRRAAELVPRLTRDFGWVRELVALHLDPAEPASEALCLRRNRIGAEFASGYARLTEYVGSRRSLGEADPAAAKRAADACRAVERSFSELVGIAVELSEVLRAEVGEPFLVSVFSRDLEEFAEILGLAFEPVADTTEPMKLWARREAAGEPPRPQRGQQDAASREPRNHRIVSARLSGVTAKEVAEAHGLSERQVGRVMAEHRRGRYTASAETVEVVDAALRSLIDDQRLLADQAAATTDRAEQRAIVQHRAMLLAREGQLLRSSGMISPEAFAASRKADQAAREAGFDLAHKASRRVRAELERLEADPELIEAAVDQIATAAELEDGAP